MDLYTFGLVLGGVGLGAMALGGVVSHTHSHSGHGHGGHGDAGHGLGDAGHGHGGHGHGGHGHGGHGHGGHSHTGQDAGHHDGAFHLSAGAGRTLLSLLSPRILFSALVGFGATGLVLRGMLAEPWLAAAALVGGIAFERLLVAPLWRFFFRFESVPALTLESCVDDEARAVTGFDADGHGLVAVELDGQIVQLLGVLTPGERGSGFKVRAGDKLRIEAVDTTRNRCTVTYLGA